MWLDIRVHKESRDYMPFLNGEKLIGCFSANEEEGWADVYVIDKNGIYALVIKDKDGNIVQEIKGKGERRFLNSGESQELKKERLYGKVEFIKVRNG